MRSVVFQAGLKAGLCPAPASSLAVSLNTEAEVQDW
jgi:hypothetical protein